MDVKVLQHQRGVKLALHVMRGPTNECDDRPTREATDKPQSLLAPGDLRAALDGPTSDGLRWFCNRTNVMFTFRISPSFFLADNEQKLLLVPLTKRLVTVRIAVSGVELIPYGAEQRYYRISGTLQAKFDYRNLLAIDMLEWAKGRPIPDQTEVIIHYDSQDVSGELFTAKSQPVLPFPMNVQRIHQDDGEFHSIIRPLL